MPWKFEMKGNNNTSKCLFIYITSDILNPYLMIDWSPDVWVTEGLGSVQRFGTDGLGQYKPHFTAHLELN